MDNPPDKLKNAAIAQLIVGLIDFFVTGWVLFFVLGTVGTIAGTVLGGVCTLLSMGLCPCGYFMPFLGFAGFLGWLAIPLGILEIIAGIVGLTNPRSGGSLMKIVAFLGCGSLLFGSLPSVIGGGLVLMFLGDDEVKAYLNG